MEPRAGAARRAWLVVGLLANLGTLGYFKYYEFFTESLVRLLSPFGLEPHGLVKTVALPIAISFFTFQGLSYLIDVYRGDERTYSLLDVSLFLAFFPQLVAGPIVRTSEFMPELHSRRNPDGVDVARGASDWSRPDQKGGDRIVDGTTGRSGVCRTRRLHGIHGVCGDPGLRRPDLRRFLRLHRHCHWRGVVAGLSLPRQLRPSLCVEQYSRLLASLAHDAVALVARLSLYSAGGQPGRPGTPVPQPHLDHGARRTLAWRQRHVHRVGPLPGAWPGGRAVDEGPPPRGSTAVGRGASRGFSAVRR